MSHANHVLGLSLWHVVALSGCLPTIDFTFSVRDGGADAGIAVAADRWDPEPVWASEPIAVAALNGSWSIMEPFLTQDGRTLFYSSDEYQAGGFEFWQATRPSLDAEFGSPTRRAELCSPAEDSRFEQTADGLLAVMASSRAGGKGLSDLYQARRASTSEPWVFAPLQELNTAQEEYDGHLADDGLTLYFSAARPEGAGLRDLYVARRSSRADTFGAPARVAELSTADDESNATLTADGTVVVFTRTAGSLPRVFFATRSSRDVAFGSPRPVPGMAVLDVQWEPFVNRDGTELLFVAGGTGKNQLYRVALAR